MPKICYKDNNFQPKSQMLIMRCNEIIAEYTKQRLKLTLRQLYYQLVSRDVIPNKQASYNNLGNLVNDARLAGLIDWDAIEDRTRALRTIAHWETPEDILYSCEQAFRLDKWKDQTYRCEVWVEKEALAGVIARAANSLDVPYFSCRGYTSQSEMWGAAMRFVEYFENGQQPYIIHLGDHDPSGIDMSRDIEERINMFMQRHIPNSDVTFKRIALNMDQVREYEPPPNPAKSTDTRFQAYADAFGDESWELDALEPTVLDTMIKEAIEEVIEQDKFDALFEEENQHRAQLKTVADRWNDVVEFVNNPPETD